jgi:hypothetical protein
MSYEAIEVVKASFNIPKDELKALKDLAGRRGIPVTQALRQAIASELFLQEQVDHGKKLIVESDDGDQMQLVFHQSASTRPAKADLGADAPVAA